MFRSLPKRAVIARLLDLLGPPPPPPRRYFAKSWEERAHARAMADRAVAGRHGEPGRFRCPAAPLPGRAGQRRN